MQRGRGGGRQNTGHTKGNQGAVEADNEAVVGVDARHQSHGDPAQLHQFPEAVGSDGDVCDLPGDGGAVADGDARVRLRQGRRVVDAVAYHQHGVSLPAEPCHILRLVRRKDSGAEVIHSHLSGNGCGGAVTVAGEHNGAGNPQSAEGREGFLCLLPQRVGDADHSGKLSPHRQIQVGILRRQGVKALLFALWNDAALILKDKVGAADEDPLPIDGAGDAVGHQIFHLGVVLLVTQASALRLLHHGVGHGMGEVLLQAGGQPQHFGFLLGAERYHLSHPGAGVGQGAGLVKDDGIGSRHSLQEFAALDGDVGASRLPHGGEDGQRHGQLQRTGEVHHQHRQGSCHIPSKGKTQQAPGKGIGHQLVRQIGGLALSLRLHLL